MPRPLKEVGTLFVILLLFLSVYLLPPDTSLAQVNDLGVLRACVPTDYPPLVTPAAAAPGIDIEVLEALAAELGVRLSLNINTEMGRDFNPRNWRLTRAQCHVVAGGIVDSPTTRAFLDVTPPYLMTGWATISPRELHSLAGVTVGFYAGVSSLDRISLSRYLNLQRAQPIVVQQLDDLIAELRRGEFDIGLTEALLARQLAAQEGWSVTWVPTLQRLPLVFGLWKGDLTLKRQIVKAMVRLEREGTLEHIMSRYKLIEIYERSTN